MKLCQHMISINLNDLRTDFKSCTAKREERDLQSFSSDTSFTMFVSSNAFLAFLSSSCILNNSSTLSCFLRSFLTRNTKSSVWSFPPLLEATCIDLKVCATQVNGGGGGLQSTSKRSKEKEKGGHKPFLWRSPWPSLQEGQLIQAGDFVHHYRRGFNRHKAVVETDMPTYPKPYIMAATGSSIQ